MPTETKITDTAPIAPEPTASSRRWSYSGFVQPTKQFGCMTCNAALCRSCLANPPHNGHTPGCPTCGAAQTGVCQSHGVGLAGAMDAHMASLVTESAKKAFAKDRAYIESQVEEMPSTAKVQVTANGYAGVPDCHARLSMVEVIQLKS